MLNSIILHSNPIYKNMLIFKEKCIYIYLKYLECTNIPIMQNSFLFKIFYMTNF